jgi:hypothetical protein
MRLRSLLALPILFTGLAFGQAAPQTPATPPATSATKAAANTAAKTPAPGGGPGMVWVNLNSKVYHCQGDRFYGTTKNGRYMTEKDAIAAGAHGARNKTCSAAAAK